ncbi:MAG: hypothetical protein V8Q27_06170 [Eubacteriales bacterium]
MWPLPALMRPVSTRREPSFPSGFWRSLKHLNRTCGEAERLSQKVFFYDAEDGSFKTVEF